jgi:hypothetical protein
VTALFDPARHEPLDSGLAWDEGRARDTVRALVRDAEQARMADGGWPVHPQDEEGAVPRGGYKSVYLGSAGVVWALWYLQREGVATLERLDPAEAIAHADAAYRTDPDTGEVVPSYYLGEVGVLLVHWSIAREPAVAERLFAAVAANIDNPTNEALWAAPGTMGAAWHLWCATGEARWRTLFLDNVAQLWRTWLWDEKAGCHVWTQDLYGSVVQYLGAGHGFAGNVYPLLKGASLLDDAQRDELYARCAATLSRAALRDGDAVNWPPGFYTPRPGRPSALVQWCHGAPGLVTALADFPVGRSAEVDALLLGAGETVWRAGPLTKGPGLCHGTAGNGYALLKLYRRSGDARWLARARAFAMHAIGQCERARREQGRGRYSLWTGDAGLAVYLWHCIAGQADLPALDIV